MARNIKIIANIVLKILEQYSDENHFLTQKEIVALIQNEYEMTVQRKTIGRAIQDLLFLGYDINRKPGGGFALLEREFEPSEVSFLADAIFSSKSISGKCAVKLANKLSNGLSIYQRKSYDYLLKSTEITRTNNAEVFYTTDTIIQAIKNNKCISFQYMCFDKRGNETFKFEGYEYKVSPCYLINNFGRYYLIAYIEKYGHTNNYRVDYIKNIRILEDTERVDPMSLDEFKNYKSITDYINEHIYMLGGETTEAIIELKDSYVVQYIYDWFGANSKIKNEDDKLYAKVKCNINALFYWCMQYGEHITVISPQELIDKIKYSIQEMATKYN